MTAVVITAALFFCNITPLKNAAKDSLPCPDNTNKFILFWVKYTYIDLGAGKHPSPLDISESYSPDLYLKVGFYLIKKYCSCPKLSQFKDRALL